MSLPFLSAVRILDLQTFLYASLENGEIDLDGSSTELTDGPPASSVILLVLDHVPHRCQEVRG